MGLDFEPVRLCRIHSLVEVKNDLVPKIGRVFLGRVLSDGPIKLAHCKKKKKKLWR